VTVFQCVECMRATVQRWKEPITLAAKAPDSQAFVFPSWYTGVARDKS